MNDLKHLHYSRWTYCDWNPNPLFKNKAARVNVFRENGRRASIRLPDVNGRAREKPGRFCPEDMYLPQVAAKSL
jgi:hypothetical protein